MASIQNVTRKQGTYYFRKLIRLGPDKPFRLRMSLKTTSRKRAALLAPAMTLICERVAMNVMAKMGSDGLTAEERAEIYRRQMLIERDRLVIMHASLHIEPPDDHDDIRKALSLRLGAFETAANDSLTYGKIDDFLIGRMDADDNDDPIVIMAWSDLAESMGLDSADEAGAARLADLGLDKSALREAMARRVVNQARIEAAREFQGNLDNPGSAYAPVQVAQYAQSLPQSSSPGFAPQAPPAGPYATMTPTEAVEKFIAHNPRTGGKDGTSRMKNGKAWTKKTRNQFVLPARLLEEVIGGRPLATLTHDDLVTLDSCFEKLHGPSWGKSPRHAEMTIWEIIDETEAKVVAGEKAAAKAASNHENLTKHIKRADLGLGISTTKRHWGFLRQLTTWFSKHQPLAELDYGAFIMDDGRNRRKLRSPYTVEQGMEIFSLPPWTGSKSYARRMQLGDLVVHDAWYFVPLIAWYSGMRRDEICGLAVDDVQLNDEHWHFEVRPTDTRRLKTISSERKVPVANELVRLGLTQYVEALRAAGETLMFPELAAESGKGTMGDAYYKRIWIKLIKELPFLGNGQGIHSFRHTAIDFMKGAGITPEIRADFAGHSLAGETEGRYSKDHLDLLREAVATIPEITKQTPAVPINLLPGRLRAPRKAKTQKKVP
ncbi:tyrosine-type recombinase/integrase [Altererythrobacter confluentis]|uniref:Tyrosine-type recombinase/integrase n=1 Tax=Allopontixanthobacter confluentis TaxID=1849021 RepID=A0A6L7GGB7_9SPHN|nr:site-specific integrase [Allopontixanthobacter confluentis]MXP14516.1 tyrosine-type recombinase/integrase [Allopontixanthobacter confluentis]